VGQIERTISASTTKLPAVGALTAANRDLWASDYVHLRPRSPLDAALLDTIPSAAILLCLDPATPGDFLTTSRSLWHFGMVLSPESSMYFRVVTR